ncbi:hypothetical protein GCM10009760_19510 [Kitasatospora kazusensis]|uniref:PKD domain-containing protein n=1 Tax=Kitasatospora kazusensis TaxID=407974 RepID=A0ABP5L0X9_9ACTN
MRLRHIAGLATAASVVLGLPAPAFAVADTSTIYVDGSRSSGCTDSGTGTQQQPFCTIQAAADAAQPGQTVQVAPRIYNQQVTLTHSGTQDKPITFRGSSMSASGIMPRLYRSGPGPLGGFVLNGVHDVVLSGFAVQTLGEAVKLNGTSRVTLDGNYLWGGSSGSPDAGAVHLTGSSSATTISRNLIRTNAVDSVLLEPGTSGAVVTGNAIENWSGAGIQATDAPGTVVTGNTVSTNCGSAVSLLGASAHSVAENNVLAPTPYLAQTMICDRITPRLVVAAASTSGTTVDYNVTEPLKSQPAYSWAGTDVATAADLAKAAPGQAVHEITGDPHYSGGSQSDDLKLAEGSPAIDSADAGAPGELPTDLLGLQPIDDPSTSNTGTGAGIRDRGAYELSTTSRQLGLSTSVGRVPTGVPVTFTVQDPGSWSPVVGYRFDFGDGTDPVTADSTSVQHTYTAAGSYTVSVVAVQQNGETTQAATVGEVASAPGPLVPVLQVGALDGALRYSAADNSTSPWSITQASYDFGDGSTPGTDNQHSYHHDGDYTVTMTVQDAGGRTATTSQLLHVAYAASTFHAMTPTRVLDTRQAPAVIGPDGSLTVPLLSRMGFGLPTLPFEQTPTAVVLNVTAVSHNSSGYLTVYPAGGDRPKTSNVNFTANQAVPNLVTVPVGYTGDVSVYTHGSTDVVVDILGYYSSVTQVGDKFGTLPPVRLLDTRSGSPLGAGGETTIAVRGQHGVSDYADAVVLNVTATDGDSGGYFTAYPSGTTRPGTSNLNFAAHQTVANQVIVPIGADGKIKLYNRSGNTHAVVDLFGYYSPVGISPGAESLFVPSTPTRLVDTRPDSPLGPKGVLAVAAGAPAEATAAVVNLTATGATASGYLTAWADGQAQPGTSNLNFAPGGTVPNHVTTPLGIDGKFDVYNSSGSTQVVADLFGYFVKP